MENITMTNATQIIPRPFPCCPQVANRRLLADLRPVQGTAVSALGHRRPSVADVSAVRSPSLTAFVRPDAYKLAHDVAHLRSGRPPV